MSGASGDKTEEPTEKKLREGRKEGQIARSADFAAWSGMLAAISIMPLSVRYGAQLCQDMLARIRDVARSPEPALALDVLVDGLGGAALVVAPIAGITVLTALATGFAQSGPHLATKMLKPKFNRMSFKSGLKRIAGPQAYWEATKITLKTAVLALLLWWAIDRLAPSLITGGAMSLEATLGVVVDAVVQLVRLASLLGLIIAFADYLMSRRRTGKQLKMTKDEVKREHKQSEGDPLLKGAIRSKQLAMSRNRMMSEVASADVLLVNPTHVAVALRYDPAKGAPMVVAKGAGAVATKIREKAAEHRIPMVADVPLARALHRACEVGQEIPPDMYAAVARVLAFVMSLRARGSAAGVHRVPVSH